MADSETEPEVDAEGLEAEVAKEDVALHPSEVADPPDLVRAHVPEDIRQRFEVHSYRNAAVILSQSRTAEFNELLDALRAFKISKKMIVTAGGNESEIPSLVASSLRPLGWYETIVQGDLVVRLQWREEKADDNGVVGTAKREKQLVRKNYLDGHKVDYVKGRVAFDLEWNSKDQTFDRDLFAFSAFAQCGVVDVGVLLTRGVALTPVFRELGQAQQKDGTPATKRNGQPRMVYEKYGASTTWMGKLLFRLNAGRNGGCPVLAIGITPACISDLEKKA